MDFVRISQDIIDELKTRAGRTDAEIAERLGISRQSYARRRDTDSLTVRDITILSAWLATSFGGCSYVDKFLKERGANK